MISSKLSQFSNIMQEFSPSQQLQQLKKSNLADIGSILIQSSRKSKFMTGLKIKKQDKVIPVPNIDSNSIKLFRGPLSYWRDLPVREGKLELMSNVVCCFGFGSDRQQVHCILARNVLTIHHQNSAKKYLCFDTTNVILTSKGTNQFSLTVANTEVNFVLRAQNERERDSWMRQIQKCIMKAHSYLKQFTFTINQPLFEEKQWVIEKEFVENCNSGDILLFQSSHTYGKLQQFITFSDYDHIGIVLKNKKNEVVIFESSSSEGVSFMFWKQMIYYRLYQGIPRLAWRRLNMQRTERDITVMQDFVMTNLHKQFELNMNKVFRFQSEIHKTEEQEKQRTYFCSELVAAFYKKLGILDQQKASTQYWPVSFSDSKQLPLLRGRLEPEKIIVFQEQILERKRK